MMKAKIGFLPLNWHVWDKDDWGEKLRDRCVEVFESMPGIDLVVPGKDLTRAGCIGEDLNDARKVVELFRRENVQGVIVGNMNFAHEIALGVVLDSLPRDMPILHINTKSGPYYPITSPTAEGETTFWRRSTDTWCGALMCNSEIKARGFKSIHVNTCMPGDEKFRKAVDSFARAVCAIQHFKGARFLQIGPRPDGFGCEAYSEQALRRSFGQNIHYVDVDTLFDLMESYDESDPAITEIMADIRATCHIVESANDTVLNMARFEHAIETLKAEKNCAAVASHCWTRLQDRFHIAACASFGRLNNKGIMTACEVDTMGAISMWAMHCASFGKVIPDFIDFTDLHPTEENVWLAWHCGNAAACLCRPGDVPTLQRNIQLGQLNKENANAEAATNHGCSWFRLKEGPVTAGRMVEYDGKFTMFFGDGVIEDMAPRTTGSYGWVRVKNVDDWETKMFENGIVHHGVIIHDPAVADAMEMFCFYLGINGVRGE